MKLKIILSLCVGVILGAVLMYFAIDSMVLHDVLYPEVLKGLGCSPIEKFHHIDKRAGVEVYGRLIECKLWGKA